MLRTLTLVALGLAALAARAPSAAAGTVGVVVTGEMEYQPPLVAQVESWLRSHGHKLVEFALDPTATTLLLDCLTVDDTSCARKVVESKARSESIVFVRTSREGAVLSLTVQWIVKGRPAVGGRRGCEPCTVDIIRGAADELLSSLASSATGTSGRLKLSSKPPGLVVMLDGVKIGITPIERDIASGPHTLTLFNGSARVGERKVQIAAGAEIEVTMDGRTPIDGGGPTSSSGPSRILPIALFAGGGLLLATSGYMFYLGQQGGPDHPEDEFTYPYATRAGFLSAGLGAVAIGVGAWFWVRGSRESAPAVALTPSGGYFGWQGRF